MTPFRRKALPLLVLVMAGSLSVANAQTRPNTENDRDDRNRRMENRDERGMQQRERKTPTELADMRLNHLQQKLELTNPQMNDLREPLVRYFTARNALRDRVRANNTEEVRSNARREAWELKQRLDERIKTVLTDDQYARYNKMMAEKEAKMKARKAEKKDDRKDKKNKKDKKGNSDRDRDNSDIDWDDDEDDEDDQMERRDVDKK